ncbi:carboxylesterase/lipase family protein [Homoserinibacter sp. GY 40078]|uniref:carboxylesterase/lipase family protein n=1 Tax=Homoserinibacter sp. GY 40078 TaxID=2603275 RepID=UPI00164F10EB|nr:carboxylesterase family protein [Homoserinibacter sp. GY 40078]
MQRNVEVTTRHGRLRGVEHRGAVSFLGVPYGASTGGANRFRPPQPVEPWEGVRDATVFGPAAPQNDTRLTADGTWIDVITMMYPRTGSPTEGGAMSEDCLVLNVWTPAVDTEKRPVMVWLHGGGFAHGTGSEMLFNGDELAPLGDVVVVTLNHRLGILGYLPLDLADPEFAHSGVAGMLDIVQALEWVRDNISAFGGDPDNVTVFGQSGGGAKVSVLHAMPAARGLFHKAIVQSGAMLRRPPAEQSRRLIDAVLAEAGIAPDEAHRLADVPLERLLEIQEQLTNLGAAFSLDGEAEHGEPSLMFAPTEDEAHLPDAPFHPLQDGTDAIPMLVGYTSHDASLLLCNDPDYRDYTRERLLARLALSNDDPEAELAKWEAAYPDEPPRLLLARIVTDESFRPAVLRLAEVKSQQSAPVWSYEFGYQTPIFDNLLGSPHSLDLPFVFRTVGRSPFAGDNADRHQVSTDMALAWTSFARSGDPNHPGIPEWRPFGVARSTMLIDTVWREYSTHEIPELQPGSIFARE